MVEALHNRGSSPRRRGTPCSRYCWVPCVRFIPAQAGNTKRAYVVIGQYPVHPRAGGEHRTYSDFRDLCVGSSPRRRGTLLQVDVSTVRRRFIPAQAGNTRTGVHPRRRRAVHPRAGGEHFLQPICVSLTGGSSPRRRGTPRSPDYMSKYPRFIPAQAGNTGARRQPDPGRPVHPRAGGEHLI